MKLENFHYGAHLNAIKEKKCDSGKLPCPERALIILNYEHEIYHSHKC